jgi:hypothetical protein
MESSFIQNKFNCYEENNSVIFKKQQSISSWFFLEGRAPNASRLNPHLNDVRHWLLRFIMNIFSNYFTDISTLDNANLRNENMVKVGRRAACIIADLCNVVEEIHQAKRCVQTFLNNARYTICNITQVTEDKII